MSLTAIVKDVKDAAEKPGLRIMGYGAAAGGLGSVVYDFVNNLDRGMKCAAAGAIAGGAWYAFRKYGGKK